MMQSRVQGGSARIRGEFSHGQPAQSLGYRGASSSVFASHSVFDMIELTARRAPTEKFNGLEPARWFIYKRLVEDEANASGCLSEIIPSTSSASNNVLMRPDGSRIGYSPSGSVFSASGIRDGIGPHARQDSSVDIRNNFMISSTNDSYSLIREQQSASQDNNVISVPMSGGLLPQSQNVPSRSISSRRQHSLNQNSSIAAAVRNDMSMAEMPSDVRELITDLPNPVDGSAPRGSNLMISEDEYTRAIGMELQPKYDEIEKSFEADFKRLSEIEDINLQDQRRKTLMFRFDFELNRESRRLEAEFRRKSMLEEKRDRTSVMSDLGGITINSNKDSIGTISVADSIKLSDKKFKKTTRMQEILRNRFETTVLDLIIDYLRVEDLAGAWRYLNEYYCSVLRNHVDVFAAALEVYRIKPQQPVTEYLWCFEIVSNMCNEITGRSWSDIKMMKLLEKGLKFDSRFSALCTTLELLDDSTAVNLSYLKFKEK